MKLTRSLKFKLPVFVICASIPLTLFSLVTATTIAKKTLEDKTEDLLNSKTKLISEKIDKFDEMNRGILKSVTTLPGIRTMDADEQIPYLQNIDATYPHIYRTMTIGIDGKSVARNDNITAKYFGDRQYFQNAIAAEQDDISYETIVGKTSKKLAVCMGRRILNEQIKIVGVAAICTDLKQISAEIGQLKFGRTGQVIIIDRSGNIIAHPEKSDRVSQQLRIFNNYPPVRNFLNGGFSEFEYAYNGLNYISLATKTANGWGVITFIEKSEFLADERRFTERMLFTGIASVIIIAIVTWFGVDRFIAPITDLRAAARAVAKGEYYNLRVNRNRRDEIGLLASAFNFMAKKVKIHHQELKAEVDKQTNSLEIQMKRTHQAKNSSRRAQSEREKFLLKISHELRSPLKSIISYAAELSSEQPYERRLQNIRNSGEYLMSLINDISDFYESKKGLLSLNPVDCNLKQLCEACIDSIKPNTNKNVKINLLIPNQIPFVKVDRKRLRQVLTNLLSNAIKFTEIGQINLTVKVIHETLNSARIEFSVSDTGIGIARHNFNKIFQPFVQLQDRLGTGLGLSISQDIIRAMQSEIKVESVVNEGSNFYFQLTLSKVKNFSLTQKYLPLKTAKKILIVEDSFQDRQTMKEHLSQLGFEIFEAEDGEEALQIANCYDDIALIITDFFMEKQSAFSLIPQLRGIQRYRSIPIILISSGDPKIGIEKALELGATVF
ncbi:MAG: ATP-binding protein, partial [Prochloraceae cyanobacterium]